MTKFEELTDIITRNKNKDNNKAQEPDDDQEMDIEVAGSEKSKAPVVSFATDDQDMVLTDQLYFKVKHKPLEGQFADRWDD